MFNGGGANPAGNPRPAFGSGPSSITDLRQLGRLPAGTGRRLPNVVLVGARATGKSRISRRLAKVMGWTRVSTDERFEERHGPIPRFVEELGWKQFRDRETEVLSEVRGERLVVDCGEGIVEQPENLAILRQLGTVYWVRAQTRILTKRVRRTVDRPARTRSGPAEQAIAALERRTAHYRMTAECDVWSTPRAGSPEAQPVTALVAAHFGPRLAFTVAAPTASLMRAGIAAAWAEAGPQDLIELRLDHLEEPVPERVAEILEGVPEPLRVRLIAKVLRLRDGGRYVGREQDRILLLLAAARHGVGYLDVEFEPDREREWAFSRRLHAAAPGARLVASYYYPDRPSTDLAEVPALMEPMHPAIRKVVARSAEAVDVARLLSLIRSETAHGRALIAIPNGPGELALRTVAHSAGAALATYVSASAGPGVGDKKPPARQIRDRYFRWGARLYSPVAVFGAVGHPIGHSLSPAIYETAFRRAGIEAAYLGFPVPPAELEDFLTAARLTEVAGLNVAIPHKTAVLPLLDGCDDDTVQIGAVDTVVRDRDRLIGTSTVWKGVVAALEEHLSLPGKRVTVIGAGGAARSVLYALMRCGARATVVARDPQRAADLADAFGADHLPLEGFGRLEGDVLVNATPVGMTPQAEACPAPPAVIRNHSLVLDLVYNPRQTKLLAVAQAAGTQIVPGINVLLHQAAAAFERWTGRPAPLRAMQDAADRAYRLL